MTEYDDDFLQKLKQLCLEFDSKASWYPDPDLVGYALYTFAKNPPTEKMSDYAFSGEYRHIGYDEES
jgi:hypothetical protein